MLGQLEVGRQRRRILFCGRCACGVTFEALELIVHHRLGLGQLLRRRSEPDGDVWIGNVGTAAKKRTNVVALSSVRGKVGIRTSSQGRSLLLGSSTKLNSQSGCTRQPSCCRSGGAL